MAGKVNQLAAAKRILVVCGQESYVSDEQQRQMTESSISSTVRLLWTTCRISNVKVTFNPSVCMDTRYVSDKKFEELLPDIVISFGGMVFSGLKAMLLRYHGKYEHWLVQEDGEVCDLFKSLTTIFACTPEYFFKYFNEHVENGIANDMKYHNELVDYADSVKYPDFGWSNIYAIKNVVTRIPSESLLHLSINNAIRITNFFKLQPHVKVYANIGNSMVLTVAFLIPWSSCRRF